MPQTFIQQPDTPKRKAFIDAYLKAFKPKIVYPYHYRGSDPAKFATLVGSAAEVRQRNWY